MGNAQKSSFNSILIVGLLLRCLCLPLSAIAQDVPPGDWATRRIQNDLVMADLKSENWGQRARGWDKVMNENYRYIFPSRELEHLALDAINKFMVSSSRDPIHLELVLDFLSTHELGADWPSRNQLTESLIEKIERTGDLSLAWLAARLYGLSYWGRVSGQSSAAKTQALESRNQLTGLLGRLMSIVSRAPSETQGEASRLLEQSSSKTRLAEDPVGSRARRWVLASYLLVVHEARTASTIKEDGVPYRILDGFATDWEDQSSIHKQTLAEAMKTLAHSSFYQQHLGQRASHDLFRVANSSSTELEAYLTRIALRRLIQQDSGSGTTNSSWHIENLLRKSAKLSTPANGLFGELIEALYTRTDWADDFNGKKREVKLPPETVELLRNRLALSVNPDLNDKIRAVFQRYRLKENSPHPAARPGDLTSDHLMSRAGEWLRRGLGGICRLLNP